MGKSAGLSRAHADPRIPALIPADPAPKNIEAPNPPSPSSSPHNTASNPKTDIPLSPPQTPLSRKEKRALKKNKSTTTPTSLPTPPPSRAPTPNLSPRPQPPMRPTSALHTASKAHPLFIASIGNPGSTYAHTLHSAGHTITSHIASVKAYKPFTKGLSGLISRPDNTTYSFSPLSGFTRTESPDATSDDWTFWQSTSLMNVSGKNLARAWREFAREKEGARLVVVHDELEAGLGKRAGEFGGDEVVEGGGGDWAAGE
ncbi:hypothetical protein GRF29_161g350389 [Pseudopithomyces chartarum]|uniref:Peptidyl-tRNA hydrolase n=1 Tax=Pseudopithomyces chartarum TaxID=1892770 RepID=A0AAN6LTW7_9PLEO|nr:hypothetical protein GRF29_161g350389 [Pseudopithomyces chartarum]